MSATGVKLAAPMSACATATSPPAEPIGHVAVRPRPRRRSRRPSSSRTSAVAAVLIAAALIVDQTDAGGFGAQQAWLYATILTVGYMVSRGLAKSGSREPYTTGTAPSHRGLCVRVGASGRRPDRCPLATPGRSRGHEATAASGPRRMAAIGSPSPGAVDLAARSASSPRSSCSSTSSTSSRSGSSRTTCSSTSICGPPPRR